MPRRKKTPPQDMDVDSDEDNAITKQKKATEKFMALLKPIKDAALAFDATGAEWDVAAATRIDLPRLCWVWHTVDPVSLRENM